MSVGNDCARCHTTVNWIVNDIPEIHEQNGFALVGAHGNLSCTECHASGNNLQFERVGNDCISCHRNDYQAAQAPNHVTNGFSTNCIECHDPMGFDWHTNNVDHDFFPLTLGHAINDCNQCHTTGSFADASPECVTCHQVDFNNTSNPNHQTAGFTTDCATCHTTNPGWTPATYDHDVWPLVGSHIPVSCDQCHNGNYTNTPNTCEACHIADYNATTAPNHAASGFPTDCAACHDETAWTNATFDHNSTAFPLTGQHVSVDCMQCHANGFTGTPTACEACHQTDFNNTVEPNHTQAQFTNDCTQCHTTDGWIPSSYDHTSATGFALNGSHANVNCNQCHANGYTNTPNTCEGCHLADYNSTTDPNHGQAGFPTDCALCHDEGSWTTATFDHNSTAFPLTGQHVSVDCMQCHANGFAGTPTACEACHQTDFNNTVEPNHTQAQFTNDCTQCHTTDGWIPSSYDHTSATGFALNGSHANVNCNQCHANGYTNTPNTCEGCHLSDYNATTDPNHGQAGFPTDCALCHDEGSWTTATFDHNSTAFPLTGQHVSVDCMQCHANGFAGTPTACEACHQTDFNNTVEPNHTQANFTNDCTQCHTTDGWTPSSYDHTSSTGFALNGSHANVNCNQCHANGYTNTPNTCEGCHLSDYNATTDPNHGQAGFPTDCALCHDEGSWTTATFDHNSTAFPLTGQHVSVDCMQCHANGFAGTPTACEACHQTDFNNTVEPNHTQANFTNDCTQCHTTDGWTPSSYDHTSSTGFALNGSHANVNCNQCHANGYTNTPNTCEGCHLADYNSTTDPNHGQAGFPTDCALCHDEGSWTTATFDHNSTAFPLTGQHITVDCMQCHTNGFAGTPTNCDACHIAEYNATTSPNHAQAGFPMDCAVCHTTSAWVPGTFDHENTGFPLTGQHVNASCIQCHANGYAGTPTNCDACHMADYNSTNNPNHASAQFPTDCATCHTTSAWDPSTFNHDQQYFPIYSGRHDGEWNTCTECHTTPGNYNLFSCIDCHEHNNQSQVNNDHSEVNGYSYTPTSCFSCHPDGEN
ncbi:MAG: hypothetical protein IPL64_01835 [Flavobacteriales bacterium]|nr:hypothetical protein [Flavobacteriales bacterium]MBK8709813.1 hypothetical protein [Flavobacteriales bacterium]